MEAVKSAKIAFTKNADRNTIVLEGAVDIFFAVDLRQAALEVLQAGEDIIVCCEKLERLDTSALQILLALKKELEQNGRKIEWPDVPTGPAALAALAGLSGHLF
jgi:anti-anti-sigma regulatory factor